MNYSPNKIRIPLNTLHTIELVWLNNINYLKGMENYCSVNLSDGTYMVSTISLGQLYKQLEDHYFFQCHKSFIVNMDKVVRYYKRGELEMFGGMMVPVARRRKEEFVSKMKDIYVINKCSMN